MPAERRAAEEALGCPHKLPALANVEDKDAHFQVAATEPDATPRQKGYQGAASESTTPRPHGMNVSRNRNPTDQNERGTRPTLGVAPQRRGRVERGHPQPPGLIDRTAKERPQPPRPELGAFIVPCFGMLGGQDHVAQTRKARIPWKDHIRNLQRGQLADAEEPREGYQECKCGTGAALRELVRR